jgi:hypothetical protein
MDEHKEQPTGQAIQRISYPGTTGAISKNAEQETQKSIVKAEPERIPAETLHGEILQQVTSRQIDVHDLRIRRLASAEQEDHVTDKGGIPDQRPSPRSLQ